MKSFYKKTFANYSPLFAILMIFVLLIGYSLRATISVPLSSIGNHANFLSKFFIPKELVTLNPTFYFKFELIFSVALLILAYFLGKAIIGKVEGLFIAIFMGFYPYFVINCYSTNNYFLLFFMLYLLFQLKACITLYKRWSMLSGVFFTLSVITNPSCIFLGIVPYIYYAIKAKNIAILYNFLFFLLGVLVTLSPFMLYVLITHKGFSYIIPFASTFAPFAKNFATFASNPLNYFLNTIVPFFTSLAHPEHYNTLSSYSYLHYIIITLSILGILYSFIEEKIRVVFLISLVILIQALFMPINFSLIFMLIIFMGSYMVDKVFHDVFC